MPEQNDKKHLRSGLTVVELMIVLILLGVVFCSGMLGLRAYHRRAEITNAVRCVTAAMQTARYRAIGLNRRIKLSCSDQGNLELDMRKNGRWVFLERVKLPTGTRTRLNAEPVFHPEGHVVPLCSVFVQVEHYRRRISISMAGRIQVMPLP